MRSIHASEIFRVACGLHGQPWSSHAGEDSLSLTDFRMLRAILSDRLNTAWHMFPWPVLVILERRQRNQRTYDNGTVYVSGDQVFDAVSNRCWQCIQPTIPGTDNPLDTPSKWAMQGYLPFTVTNDPNTKFQIGDRVFNPIDSNIYYCFTPDSFFADINQPTQFSPLIPFNPAFPLDDGWQKPMEEVLEIAPVEQLERGPSKLEFDLIEDAVRVEGQPGSAFFRYRLQCPELTGDPWDEEATYAIADQVYYTDSSGAGDFWNCIHGAQPGETPGSDPLLWTKIELPYIFGPYLGRALHADWYELDGQTEKAASAAVAAFERLQLEFDKIERQQRQLEPWTVATR